MNIMNIRNLRNLMNLMNVKHILFFCLELRESRLNLIREAGTYDLREILTGLRDTRAAAY